MSAVESSSAPPDARARFRDGARQGLIAVLPLSVATLAWGLVSGVAMVKSGLTESMALTMSFLVYAGSAQLTSLPLIAAGAPVWLIFAAGLIVNLRFLIFSAALHPYLRHLSWRKRLALGYFTTDTSFVLFMPRFGDAKVKGTHEQVGYFVGCLVPGWVAWQVSSVAGVFLGATVPSEWSLDFAAILTLLALAVPLVKTRPALLAVLVASAVAWLGQPLPLRLGLAAAVLSGVAMGVWAEMRLDPAARETARLQRKRSRS
jgi:predicted branched-subunit amino acid permease